MKEAQVRSEWFLDASLSDAQMQDFKKYVVQLCRECCDKLIDDASDMVSDSFSEDDAGEYVWIEVGDFLRVLQCPFGELTSAAQHEFQEASYRRLLVDFLQGEIATRSLLLARKPMLKIKRQRELLRALEKILPRLGLSTQDTDQDTLSVLLEHASEYKNKMAPLLMQTAEMINQNNEELKQHVQDLSKRLHDDYALRRLMILRRLDVTFQTFSTLKQLQLQAKSAADSEITTDQLTKMTEEYDSIRMKLWRPTPQFDLYDVQNARSSLVHTFEARRRTKGDPSSTSGDDDELVHHLKRMLMTDPVPDRGGRVSARAIDGHTMHLPRKPKGGKSKKSRNK